MAYFNFKDIDNSNVEVEQGVSGKLSDYDFGTYDADKFRTHLMRMPVSRMGSSVIPEDAELPVPMNTIRQLYEVCKANPDAEIFPGVKGNELLLDRSNAAEHTELFEGTRLLELRYYDCEPESDVIMFKYAYTEEKQHDCNFNVRIFISNPMLYNDVLRMLYEYNGPVLIYDSWRPTGGELLGTISSKAQFDRI